MIGKPPIPPRSSSDYSDYFQTMYKWTIDVYKYLIGFLKADTVIRVTANYTTNPDDRQIGVTSTTAPRTITISSSSIAVKDFIVSVNDESGNASVNNVTVATEGAENIYGTAVITTDYGSLKFRSNGSHLFNIT